MKQISLDTVREQGVSHNAAIRKRVMLHPSDLPHVTQFAQAQFAPGQVAAGHAHADMHEVFFVQAGQGTITIDGQPYPLSPGECVAVAPGEVHEVQNTGTAMLTLLYFGVAV